MKKQHVKDSEENNRNLRQMLRDRPIIAVFLIFLLYGIFLVLPSFIQILLSPILSNLSYSIRVIIDFSLTFGFLAILLLIIIPFGLNFPDGKQSFKEYVETIRLNKLQPLWRNILIGIACTGVIFLSATVISLFLGTYIFDPKVLFKSPNDSTGERGWLIFIYVLNPGIWEEVTARGVALTLLLKKYSKKSAIIIDGVAFGVAHILNLLFYLIGGGELNNDLLVLLLSQIMFASFAGIYLAYMFEKSKSLIPCIITHYLGDVFGQLFINISGIFLVVGLGAIPMVINIFLIRFVINREVKSMK